MATTKMKENNEIGEQLHGTELNVFLLYQSIKGGTRHSRKKGKLRLPYLHVDYAPLLHQ